MNGRARLSAIPACFLLPECGPSALVSAEPPRSMVSHRFTESLRFVGEEPVPELGVLNVGIVECIHSIRLCEVPPSYWAVEPAVVRLALEIEYPARRLDVDPVANELFHERVEPFPAGAACERYAAARRSTSTSCSRSQLRLRSSRSSAFSEQVTPGFWPVSTSSARSHLSSVPTWMPKSFAICASVISGPQLNAIRMTSSRNPLRQRGGTGSSLQASRN